MVLCMAEKEQELPEEGAVKMLQDVTRCDAVLEHRVMLCCFRLSSSALGFPSGEMGRAQKVFQSIAHQAAVLNTGPQLHPKHVDLPLSDFSSKMVLIRKE